MTKGEFLRWLERFRRTTNIRTVVEQRYWSEPELDRLKETLELNGRLELKNEYRRRIAWG